MQVHVLQHVPFEELGSIASWLAKHDANCSYTRFFENPALPSLADLDLVVALGGPMSVNDEIDYPWLRTEKRFLREAIDRGVAVLGICLGAQLIASALGSGVYPNTEKEIGWFPVAGVPQPARCFRFPGEIEVFHWHGETFDLPPGALHLASTPACRNQAFQYGDRVIGLQFHLETTPESLDAIIVNSRTELTCGSYIQSEADLRAVSAQTFVRANRLMDEILAYLCR